MTYIYIKSCFLINFNVLFNNYKYILYFNDIQIFISSYENFKTFKILIKNIHSNIILNIICLNKMSNINDDIVCLLLPNLNSCFHKMLNSH